MTALLWSNLRDSFNKENGPRLATTSWFFILIVISKF